MPTLSQEISKLINPDLSLYGNTPTNPIYLIDFSRTVYICRFTLSETVHHRWQFLLGYKTVFIRVKKANCFHHFLLIGVFVNIFFKKSFYVIKTYEVIAFWSISIIQLNEVWSDLVPFVCCDVCEPYFFQYKFYFVGWHISFWIWSYIFLSWAKIHC